MPRTMSALTITVLFASLGYAQEGPLGSRAGRPGQLADTEWIEFEVVSVEPNDWTVVAKDVESGASFNFRMPPQVFQGQRFTADFSGAGPGQAVSVQGNQESRLEKLVVEAPLGAAGVGGLRRTPPRSQARTPRPPAGGPGGLEYDAPGAALGERPGAKGGGPAQYQIVSVDARRWVVTASGPQGATVEFEVDPEAFVGYRFKAPVQGLRRGEGFALLALNQKPIEACCKLVGGGR